MVKYGGRVLAIAVGMSVTAIPPAPGRHTSPCRAPGLRGYRARAVNPAAGRGRRTAEVDAGEGCAIEAPCRAEEKLPDIDRPAVEIAAGQVGIVALHGGGAENVPPQNALPEAGGEPLHLRLNGIRHVRRRPLRHAAVRPP